MNWFLIALIAPLLWTFSNYIDKFVMARYLKSLDVGSLVIFIGLVDALFIPIAFLFDHHIFSFPLSHILILALFGCLITWSFILYFYALENEDTSIVVPLYQLTPVFTYFLALLFLHEALNTKELLASVVIILGSILISLDITERLPKIKLKVLGSMALSCLIIAASSVAFKYVAIRDNYWVSTFWTYVGSGISSVILILFVKPYRQPFIKLLTSRQYGFLTLDALSEGLNILANVAVRFAFLLAPVTLVWVVNGLQPAFVFTLGLILTLFFPDIIKENIVRKHLIQKITAIALIFLGTVWLNI